MIFIQKLPPTMTFWNFFSVIFGKSGYPTYLRTWKTFNSRLPGGIWILMPLALIHLTYLSELCFSKMFYGFYDDSFHKKIHISDINMGVISGNSIHWISRHLKAINLDPIYGDPIFLISHIIPFIIFKGSLLFQIQRESQIFHSFKSRSSTFSSVSKCLLTQKFEIFEKKISTKRVQNE